MNQLNLIFDGHLLSDGQRLYHYTDAHGFLSIVKSKKVWATDYKFLNDPSEHSYGKTIVKEVIEECIKENPATVLKDIYQIRFGQRKIVGETYKRGYYLVSLSEEKDSLEQWRAYGDHGKGFAVEFDISKKYMSGEIDFLGEIPHMLMKVIYDRNVQKQITRDILTHCLDTTNMDLMLIDFLINYLCIKFKSPHFANEKEWRVVYSPLVMAGSIGSNIEYRDRANCLISYNSFELESITGAVIGPCRSKSDMLMAYQIFSDHLQIFPAAIYDSSVPFRS